MPYADGDGKVHIDDCLLRNVVREAEDTARRALRFRDPPRGGGTYCSRRAGTLPLCRWHADALAGRMNWRGWLHHWPIRQRPKKTRLAGGTDEAGFNVTRAKRGNAGLRNAATHGGMCGALLP
jgi:hypothetical protein